MTAPLPQQTGPQPARVLLVDDDARLRDRIHRAMRARGIDTIIAGSAEEALERARESAPTHAVVDLRMPDVSGIDLIPRLAAALPGVRIVVLTGYGSIATAVEAMRRGANDYLTKPADVDQILGALGLAAPPPPSHDVEPDEGSAPSLERVEWEHIQRVLSDCSGNVTQAARVLGVHRRTLQRKLAIAARSR
jgi:two-component system, response regulator RegA